MDVEVEVREGELSGEEVVMGENVAGERSVGRGGVEVVEGDILFVSGIDWSVGCEFGFGSIELRVDSDSDS